MIYKSVKKGPHIELVGDNSERKFRFWGPVTDAVDHDGEFTPPEAMKANMDWFINELGGPITVNHTHRVVGHAKDWGMGTHPKNGKPAMWVEGVITRGPGGKAFPAADTVWNKLKSGQAKGSSWAGDILKEVTETDMNTFKEKITNEEVLPYSWGLVVDYANERPNPSLPESEIIEVNERAKAEDEFYIQILEEQPMTDEKQKTEEQEPVEEPKPEEPVVEDKTKTEQAPAPDPDPEAPVYVTVQDLEKFKTELMGMLAPPSPEKEKQVEMEEEEPNEYEKKPEDDDSEDEKKKTETETVKDLLDQLEKKKAEVTALIDKVGTPAPAIAGQEKSKTEQEKRKTINEINAMPIGKRLDYLASIGKED